MFTKDPGLKALASIKSSQRRKLATDVQEIYRIPEELKPFIVPSSVKSATYKSSLGHSGTIYADNESVPIYFKTKDTKLIPTIYTTWRAPTLLPIVLTNSFVISKIEGGAHLMLPGTIPPFDSRCVKGAIVGIASYESPIVVHAIGVCELNLTNFESVQGKSGIAVRVWHFQGDELFNISRQKIGEPTNDELLGILKSIGSNGNDNPEVEEVVEQIDEVHIEGKEEEAISEGNNVQDIANNEPEEVTKLETADVDYLFKRGFLLTLQQDGINLPISPSNFISNHLLKNLPYVPPSLESSLTIKKTSWKKSVKFFKEMEKAKYLKLKGKDDNMMIIEVVNKDNNEEIKNFVPHKVQKKTTNNNHNLDNNNGSKLNILTLYKPTSKTRLFFTKLSLEFNTYYYAKEISTFLNNYISKYQLANAKNKKMVVLDEYLNDLINSNSSMRNLGRDKIIPLLLKQFTQCYLILKPGEQVDYINNPPIKGQIPKIKIVSEMRLGRKIITRTSNFEKFNVITADELASYLRVKCSGSTTIGNCKENPKLTEVTVQGPHIKTITQLFIDKGISVTYIESTDRTKSKKKH